MDGVGLAPRLSLLFDAAARPGAPAIRQLAEKLGSFSISHDPLQSEPPAAEEIGWLELLANGLSFDLLGLEPGGAQAISLHIHRFGLPESLKPDELEAVVLVAGPHLSGGETMLPVVRSQLWLATQLCGLPGLQAVGWNPARSLSSPAHFSTSVTRWLEGGVFPALGLTALVDSPDGGLQSEGLAFFTGQELRIEPELAEDKASAARLAIRLIHELVGMGWLNRPEVITGPEGEALKLEPSLNGRFVRVRLAQA